MAEVSIEFHALEYSQIDTDMQYSLLRTVKC